MPTSAHHAQPRSAQALVQSGRVASPTQYRRLRAHLASRARIEARVEAHKEQVEDGLGCGSLCVQAGLVYIHDPRHDPRAHAAEAAELQRVFEVRMDGGAGVGVQRCGVLWRGRAFLAGSQGWCEGTVEKRVAGAPPGPSANKS